MKPRPSLIFYVEQSPHAGSVQRSLALTRALAARFDVTVITSGPLPRYHTAPEDVTFVNLPAVAPDDRGLPVSGDRKHGPGVTLEHRRRILLEIYRGIRPRVLLVERVPFGRTAALPEIESLLEEARSRRLADTLVCCSLKTDFVRAAAGFHGRVATTLERYFHAVLAHGDPAIARLGDAADSPVPLYYTGFLHASGTAPVGRSHVRPGTIAMSAGAGLCAELFLRVTIAASAHLPPGDWPPLMLVGGSHLTDDVWQRLSAHAARCPNVHMRRAVPHVAAELCRSTGSISDCAYDTIVDVLRSGVPATVIPFDTPDDGHQLKRARRLQKLGAVRALMPENLTTSRVAAELVALREFKPSPMTFDFGGAERSVRILETLCQSDAWRLGTIRLPGEEVVS